MGPHKGPSFETIVDTGFELRLGLEEQRRLAVGTVLADVSKEFGCDEALAGQVTEPTLAFKLLVLAHVQNSPLGVVGFDPRGNIDRTRSAGTVKAFAAPPHDSYKSGTSTVYTRVVKLLPTYGDEDIEVFGLNLYAETATAGSDDIKALAEYEHPAQSRLTLVTPKGSVTNSTVHHVTGETPIIAVRNNKTGDAKVYSIREVPYDQLISSSDTDDYLHATIPVSQAKAYEVRVLTGNDLTSVVQEFYSAKDALEKAKAAGDGLTPEERTAVSTL